MACCQTRYTAKPWAQFLTLALLCSHLAAQQNDYTFRAQAEIVLVNVTVRDKSGKFVRDLKAEDFTLTEDGKSQRIISFDVENTDALPPSEVPQADRLSSTHPQPSGRTNTENPGTKTAQQYKDR